MYEDSLGLTTGGSDRRGHLGFAATATSFVSDVFTQAASCSDRQETESRDRTSSSAASFAWRPATPQVRRGRATCVPRPYRFPKPWACQRRSMSPLRHSRCDLYWCHARDTPGRPCGRVHSASDTRISSGKLRPTVGPPPSSRVAHSWQVVYPLAPTERSIRHSSLSRGRCGIDCRDRSSVRRCAAAALPSRSSVHSSCAGTCTLAVRSPSRPCLLSPSPDSPGPDSALAWRFPCLGRLTPARGASGCAERTTQQRRPSVAVIVCEQESP